MIIPTVTLAALIKFFFVKNPIINPFNLNLNFDFDFNLNIDIDKNIDLDLSLNLNYIPSIGTTLSISKPERTPKITYCIMIQKSFFEIS